MRDIERESVLSDLEGTRLALLRTLEEIPEELFFAAPAEGCWSPAATLEHVVFVEGRALGLNGLRFRSRWIHPGERNGWPRCGTDRAGVRNREGRVQGAGDALADGRQTAGGIGGRICDGAEA